MPISSEADWLVPKHNERPHKPGLYLALLHGREYPKQQMHGWGTDGPLIGPIRWCHTTYATTIRIEFESADDESRYFNDVCFPDAHDIQILEDLLVYNGIYYGDWSVLAVAPEEVGFPEDTFRPERRRMALGRRCHA